MRFTVRPFDKLTALNFLEERTTNLEFTEGWLDEATTLGSPLPIKPPKPSRRRPLLWVVFFLLIGGGAYAAIEPEMVMEYLRSLLGEPPAPQPLVARNPAPPMAAPSKQLEQDWSFLAPGQTTAPASPAAAPTPTASAPIKAPSPATPVKQPEPDWSFLSPAETPIPSSQASAQTATASAPAKTPPPATLSKESAQDWSFLAPDDTATPSSLDSEPPTTASAPTKQVELDQSFLARIESIRKARISVRGAGGTPIPMFHEGQRVSVRADLNAPGWTVLLRQDAEGVIPGLTIPPGTLLTILDGSLQGHNWVYFVRSDIGSEGWLTEGQLRSARIVQRASRATGDSP
ncbi:MAG: hypothetical protein IPP12_09865 [Nitrospira sp.]|nr:hypothetical protein [Nitrospira sp.]